MRPSYFLGLFCNLFAGFWSAHCDLKFVEWFPIYITAAIGGALIWHGRD